MTTNNTNLVVQFLNDDVTTFEFVLQELLHHFEILDFPGAVAFMLRIHKKGRAFLPHPDADRVVAEITATARAAGFPLQVRVVKPARPKGVSCPRKAAAIDALLAEVAEEIKPKPVTPLEQFQQFAKEAGYEPGSPEYVETRRHMLGG